MEHKPISQQRSQWVHLRDDDMAGYPCKWWRRNVSDGVLTACTGLEPQGWHMSISHKPHGKSNRYPTWDEIAHARFALLPLDLEYAMFLPREGDYVNVHDTTFHLHQFPPAYCQGVCATVPS